MCAAITLATTVMYATMQVRLGHSRGQKLRTYTVGRSIQVRCMSTCLINTVQLLDADVIAKFVAAAFDICAVRVMGLLLYYDVVQYLPITQDK